MKRVIPIIIIVLILTPYFSTIVNGAVTTIPSRYARTLPTNTIYFDDFQQGTNQWLKTIVGTSTNTQVIQNSTISFDGNSSLGIVNPNANTQVIAGKLITIQADILGVQVWIAFNVAMYTTVDGQAPEVSLEYYDIAHNVHEFEVEYRPARGEWVLFGNTSPNQAGPSPRVLNTFPGSLGIKNGIKPYNDATWNTWYWVKMVINLKTDAYLSVCTATACFQNATNYYATSSAASSIAPDPDSRWMRLKITNDATTLNANALFSDLLITDETPGVPSIIQFSVNGAAIILLMFIGIIGILYYLRIGDRLMFGKGKGLFGSRTIIKYPEKSTTAEQEAKKMVKTIAILLVIGAILTAFALYFTGFI